MSLVRIADLGTVIRGVSWDKTEASDVSMPGYVPVLRAGNISDRLDTDNDLVWVPASNVSATQTLRVGDIAICMSSGSASVVGKTAISQAAWPGSVGAFCAILRADPTVCLPEYLAFYLKSPSFRAWTSEAQGANIKNIKKSALENFKIELPNMAEQRRIVDVLTRAESIVRLRREAQQKAAELVPAIFLDMFGDPAGNPKGWPVVALGDAISSADYGTSVKANDDASGIPVIRMGNVAYDGGMDLSDLKFLSREEANLERFGLNRGDILFNRTNSKELVGKTGIWLEDREAVAASYFIRLRAAPMRTCPHYLWAFMNTRHMKRVLFETARGAIGQSNINGKELRTFAIPLPPLHLQSKFAERAQEALSIERLQADAMCKAEAAFKAILARIFGT